MSDRVGVLVCVPSWTSAANMLRTGPFETLTKASSAMRVVLVSPLTDDPRFRDEFGHPRVAFERLEPYTPTRGEGTVYSILADRFVRDTRLEAARLQRDRLDLLADTRRHRIRARARGVAAALPAPRAWWMWAAGHLGEEGYAALFRRHAPRAVVTATAGLHFAELPLIRRARREGVPVMAVDLSWDHLTMKSQTFQPMDRLVVWNDGLRDEALRYHGYAPDQVEVSGVPQFDHYFRREGLLDAGTFLRGIGADPARRLITFATVPQSRHATQPRLIQRLHDAAADGRFAHPVTVLVRLHPQDDLAAYRAVEALDGVIVEKPFTPAAAHDPVGVDPDVANRVHQANTLAHSAVVVSMASTISIEACIFDTPVVNFSCDDPATPLALSPRRYYHFEHYKRILAAGGVTLASDADDLVERVAAYLADPARDRVGRQRVVRELCGPGDGRAGERLAEAILRFITDAAARHPGR